MRRGFLVLAIFGWLLGGGNSAIAETSYKIADYFPLQKGNGWFFDRNAFVVSNLEYTFSEYQGIFWVDARNYYDNAAYVYNGTDGLLVVGLYGEGALVDLSDTPIVLANPTMEVEGEVTSIIPAGKIDENAITITSTLVAVETVSVTAGNFENALKFRYDIFDSPSSTYTEIVWFAKGVGPVRTYRQSENPPNHEGCLWTCGSFDEDFDVVEERDLQLRSYVKTRRCGPVIFLGD